MTEALTDSFEDYLERHRQPGYRPTMPAPKIGPRLRARRAVRDALPRPVYELAVGRAADLARRAVRRNPGRGRLLPDFLVIGAAKAGTTSLYWWLGDHPRVEPARLKEAHFFDYNFFRGVDWYRSAFPLARDRMLFARDHGRPFLTGEASASYLSHDWAPARAARVVPRAKIIVLFREPADRAYSHYQMSRREGIEELSFEAALAHEAERLGADERRVRTDRRYNSVPLGAWSYLRRSRYAEHVERWLAFFPREQFLFLKSEDVFEDPYGALDTVHAFLGLPEHRPTDLPRLKWAGSYEPMSPETRAHLVEYFRPHNDRLHELTGVEFAWEPTPA